MRKKRILLPLSLLKPYQLLTTALWKQKFTVMGQTMLSILVVMSEGLGIGLVLLVLGSSPKLAENLTKLPTVQALLHLTSALSIPTRIQLAVLVLIVVILGRSGLQYGQNLVGLKLKKLIEGDLNRMLLYNLYRLPIVSLQKKQSGNILALFTQHCRRIGQIVQTTNLVIANLVVLFFYCMAALFISWPMTLVSIALLAPMALLIKPVLGRRQRLKARRTRDLVKGVMALLHENLAAMKVIHIFNRQQWGVDRTQAAMEAMYQAEFQSEKLASQNKPLFTFFITVSISIILLVGSVLPISSQALIIPQMVVFLLIAFRLMIPVSTFTTFMAQLGQIRPLLEEITKFITSCEQQALPDGNRMFSGLQREISLKNIEFRYDLNGPLVLKGINVTILAGRTVAVVGPSGSGKTSLIHMITRLYDPVQGQVFVDGIDLRCYQVGSWRERVAVVNQDLFLFHATIWENLRFAKPSASCDEMIAACKMALAHDFIMSMPHGYDTLLEERGMRLSGGQRQRIALARAFLIDADLLILDEATSELDSLTEEAIHTCLKAHHPGRGLLIITHRLSTIQGCDHIIVLDNGQVLEEGSHEELMAKSSIYSTFFQAQHRGITPL